MDSREKEKGKERIVNDRIVLPESFYLCEVSYLTHMIADMLCTLVSHNDQIPVTPSNLTRFHSRTPPSISISDYLRRIHKYASLEKSVLLLILIYIDRICSYHPSFTISSLTVHRFIITAVTVGSKAVCDSYCTNSHYAKVGGISTQELNTLELEFLGLSKWDVNVSGELLEQYYRNLIRQNVSYTRQGSSGPGNTAGSPTSSELPTSNPNPTVTNLASNPSPTDSAFASQSQPQPPSNSQSSNTNPQSHPSSSHTLSSTSPSDPNQQ